MRRISPRCDYTWFFYGSILFIIDTGAKDTVTVTCDIEAVLWQLVNTNNLKELHKKKIIYLDQDGEINGITLTEDCRFDSLCLIRKDDACKYYNLICCFLLEQMRCIKPIHKLQRKTLD